MQISSIQTNTFRTFLALPHRNYHSTIFSDLLMQIAFIQQLLAIRSFQICKSASASQSDAVDMQISPPDSRIQLAAEFSFHLSNLY